MPTDEYSRFSLDDSTDSSSQQESLATPTREPPKTPKNQSPTHYDRLVQTVSSMKDQSIVETVSSMKDIATDALEDVKIWANQSLNKHSSSHESYASDAENSHWADDISKLYAPPAEDDNPISPASSDRAVQTLYGAKTKMKLLGEKFQKQNSINSNDSSKPTKRTILQNIMSPFLACGGVVVERVKTSTPPNCVTPTRSSNKTRSSTNLLDPIMAAFENTPSFDDGGSLATCGSAEDQIRRMTSWGTYGTQESAKITLDDYGQVIPQKLIQQRERRRQQRHQRRKRVVKFDYPPISSVRECPRVDKRDLPKLFFSEEELDELEHDRYSTMTADDVEIVAIQSDRSKESLSEDWDERMYRQTTKSTSTDASGDSEGAHLAGFSRYNSTPKLAKKGRSMSSSNNKPERDAAEQEEHAASSGGSSSEKEDGSSEKEDGSSEKEDGSNDGERDPPSPTSTDEPRTPQSLDVPSYDRSERKPRSKKLVKGVQIYLRERSTTARNYD